MWKKRWFSSVQAISLILWLQCKHKAETTERSVWPCTQLSSLLMSCLIQSSCYMCEKHQNGVKLCILLMGRHTMQCFHICTVHWHMLILPPVLSDSQGATCCWAKNKRHRFSFLMLSYNQDHINIINVTTLLHRHCSMSVQSWFPHLAISIKYNIYLKHTNTVIIWVHCGKASI